MRKIKKNFGPYGSIFHAIEFMKEREKKARLKEKKIKSGVIKPRVTTPAQATQRMRFGLMGKFIGKIKDAVKVGFYHKFNSPIATAIQVNSKQGVIGEYPDVSIFYELIIISRGNLWCVSSPKIILSAIGTAQVTWDGIMEGVYQPDNARVYVLIFNSTIDKVLYSNFIGSRLDVSVKFDIPHFNVFDDLHCWIFTKSDDDKKMSRSEYLDDMTVKD